jgi:hypothetical protein
MLMDNIGVGGGNAGENKGIFGVPENTPNPMGEVPNFEEFLKEREDLKPQMEAPGELIENAGSSVGERASEQVSSAMPAAKLAEDGDEARETLGDLPVPRDAEKLPKAYQAAVAKIINRNSKDPHKLLAELDVARWDFMKKAFARNRGDGLNGSQLNG